MTNGLKIEKKIADAKHCFATDMTTKVPNTVLKAAHATLCSAMVFCREHTRGQSASQQMIHELMHAVHSVPDTLDTWGLWGNIDMLRDQFDSFDHAKWRSADHSLQTPNLLAFFNAKLKELSISEAEPTAGAGKQNLQATKRRCPLTSAGKKQ